MSIGAYVSGAMLVLNAYVIVRDVSGRGEFPILTFLNFLFYGIVALPMFLIP